MATHSSIRVWEIPRTEGPWGHKGSDMTESVHTSTHTHTYTHTHTHTPKDGGWLPGKPTMCLEGWKFQSHSLDPQGGED